VGRRWDEATATAAANSLEAEFTPIDDMRASAAYRRRVLANLMRRFQLETTDARIAFPTREARIASQTEVAQIVTRIGDIRVAVTD